MAPPYLMGAPLMGGAVDLGTTLGGTGGALSPLNWRLPKTGDSEPGIWFCPGNAEASAVVGGIPGVPYAVELHFVGVVEEKAYAGGTNDGGNWQIGGTPRTDGGTPAALIGPNIYSLAVSDPPQTYYLNRSPDSSHVGPVAIDYVKTITINGGATVTLTANAVAEVTPPHVGETRELSHSISVGGVTSPSQPYLGQWINMYVNSVTP